MLSKILIANRGEVALRVIRACHELDIPCVAVYSEADAESLPVKEADEIVCIGPGPVSGSYLRIPNIIGAAEITGCDAIHPGYGFLAENPDFVLACEDNDMVFIGPGADLMRRMGDKSLAKQTMRKARIPVVPGSEGAVPDAGEAARLAESYGYPVMVKASRAVAGGACAWSIRRPRWRIFSTWPAPKPKPLSATARCTWKRRSSARIMSRSRCW